MDNEMTTNEVKEAKADLEAEIYELIQRFED